MRLSLSMRKSSTFQKWQCQQGLKGGGLLASGYCPACALRCSPLSLAVTAHTVGHFCCVSPVKDGGEVVCLFHIVTMETVWWKDREMSALAGPREEGFQIRLVFTTSVVSWS
ncbi:hypothetical protein AAFF_G00226690 [Aldrovandia affinis]|uniref:Uncharacterized protein n=1 Tax=Aldrovandia affinis TaxID=143900 RepID=A0AAD7TBA9_9TELE|nr:hypothetical protein AAFF_G00226690 [Aldrovandia affinis]